MNNRVSVNSLVNMTNKKNNSIMKKSGLPGPAGKEREDDPISEDSENDIPPLPLPAGDNIQIVGNDGTPLKECIWCHKKIKHPRGMGGHL